MMEMVGATPSLTLLLVGGGEALFRFNLRLTLRRALGGAARHDLNLPLTIRSADLLRTGRSPPPAKGRVREGVRVSGFQTSLQRTRARAFRQNMTPAERVLWYHLRAHRFGGLSVRRQAPIGPFIVDFLIPRSRFVIEIDGGHHAENERDVARDAWLAAQGYRVLRFWNDDVLRNTAGVLSLIAAAVPRSVLT